MQEMKLFCKESYLLGIIEQKKISQEYILSGFSLPYRAKIKVHDLVYCFHFFSAEIKKKACYPTYFSFNNQFSL